jgi:hypothetical protein
MKTRIDVFRSVLMFAALVAQLSEHTVTRAQSMPDFSGTWEWTSRKVLYPLVIRQDASQLTVEARGLIQGPPTETFRLNGSSLTTVFEAPGYWRRYDTDGHWDGSAFIGTVWAKAGWTDKGSPDTANMALPHTICTRTLRLQSHGKTLTIESSCHSPEQGDLRVETTMDLLVRR